MAGALAPLHSAAAAGDFSSQRMRRSRCTSSFSSSASISAFIADHPPLRMLETNCRSMRDLRALQAQLIKTGLDRDPIAISRLLAFCATHPSGDAGYALRLFSRIANPNLFAWNTIIRTLARSSNPLLAIFLFLDMLLRSPAPPQRLTFPSLFSACAHLGSAQTGAQLHGMATKLGLADDQHMTNAMIFMYGSCGDLTSSSALFNRRPLGELDAVACNSMLTALLRKPRLEDARLLFDAMPQRTISTWSTIMSGYLRHGRFQETLDLFREMQTSGLEPNAGNLVTLLGACAGLGALEQGRWAHSFILSHGMEINPIIANALINMYCNCGKLDEALETFESSPDSIKRALSPWNSVIRALAVHGHGARALRFFSRMKTVAGLKPDAVTFVAVLSACAHAGMVDEARDLFAAMEEKYGVERSVEHYGCMVDILGRAGRLREGEEMIKTMPLQPDVAVWGSLLSASRSHGDLEMAERAAAAVLALDPADAGGYLLLANARAASGEFGAAAGVRAAMKEKKAWRKPGCSMIEVDGVAHEFVAA